MPKTLALVSEPYLDLNVEGNDLLIFPLSKEASELIRTGQYAVSAHAINKDAIPEGNPDVVISFEWPEGLTIKVVGCEDSTLKYSLDLTLDAPDGTVDNDTCNLFADKAISRTTFRPEGVTVYFHGEEDPFFLPFNAFLNLISKS